MQAVKALRSPEHGAQRIFPFLPAGVLGPPRGSWAQAGGHVMARPGFWPVTCEAPGREGRSQADCPSLPPRVQAT